MSKQKKIRLSLNIGLSDLQHKTNQIKKFCEKGLETKVELSLRGRVPDSINEELVKQNLRTMLQDFKIINLWNKGDNYYALIRP